MCLFKNKKTHTCGEHPKCLTEANKSNKRKEPEQRWMKIKGPGKQKYKKEELHSEHTTEYRELIQSVAAL